MEKNQPSQGELDQVKKYLNLLRQAQNEALIGLIAEGLQKEIQNEPLRVTQVVIDYLTKDILKGDSSDFTRL